MANARNRRAVAPQPPAAAPNKNTGGKNPSRAGNNAPAPAPAGKAAGKNPVQGGNNAPTPAPKSSSRRNRDRDEDEDEAEGSDSSSSSSPSSSASSSSSSSSSSAYASSTASTSSSSSDGKKKKKSKRKKERLSKRLKKETREFALDNRISSIQDSRAISKVLAPKWGRLKKFSRYMDQMTNIIRDRMDKLPFKMEKKAAADLRDIMSYVMKTQKIKFKSTAKAARKCHTESIKKSHKRSIVDNSLLTTAIIIHASYPRRSFTDIKKEVAATFAAVTKKNPSAHGFEPYAYLTVMEEMEKNSEAHFEAKRGSKNEEPKGTKRKHDGGRR